MASELERLKVFLEQLEWFGGLGSKDENVEVVKQRVQDRIRRIEEQAEGKKPN